MKRRIKKLLFIPLAILLAVALLCGFALIHSMNYTVPVQAAAIQNATGLVQASGRSLYDPQGNRLHLTGINAGQILVQEGWMSPFALEPLNNEDGSYVTDADGNLQYPEFSEEEFRAGLKSNPNLAGYDLDELLQYYYNCFFTEVDFRIIKEDLGLNAIRLPIYYLNLLNEDLTPKDEDDAFAYLDWFIAQAAKHELYIILDLHGAPGSQNGFEHSGVAEREANLWTSQENMDATVVIWDMISQHYTQTRSDLGAWIACYDLLNEPTVRYMSITTKTCWDFFDRLYDTIRGNGDHHVITMEGCWDFATLPNPADYGWKNVQYEYHWYNWWPDIIPYEAFYAYQDFTNLLRDYDVPVLIGEFTLFEDQARWAQELELFRQRGYNWTIWNYKTTVTGWWTSSWGVYTCQLNLGSTPKCNVATCTYEEFIAACDATRTENCATGTLYKVLQDYRANVGS